MKRITGLKSRRYESFITEIGCDRLAGDSHEANCRDGVVPPAGSRVWVQHRHRFASLATSIHNEPANLVPVIGPVSSTSASIVAIAGPSQPFLLGLGGPGRPNRDF